MTSGTLTLFAPVAEFRRRLGALEAVFDVVVNYRRAADGDGHARRLPLKKVEKSSSSGYPVAVAGCIMDHGTGSTR